MEDMSQCKDPFAKLCDTLYRMTGVSYTFTDKNQSNELKVLSAYFNKAYYNEDTLNEPHDPQILDRYLSEKCLPYKIEWVISNSNPSEITFTVKYSHLRCNNTATGRINLTRYSQESQHAGFSPEFDISEKLMSWKWLYDAVYGYFFPKDHCDAYTVQEINLLLYHRKIPCQIRSAMIANGKFRHGPVKSYHFEECVWCNG